MALLEVFAVIICTLWTALCQCPNNTVYNGFNCDFNSKQLLQCTSNSCPANSDCFVANGQINCVCKQGSTTDANGNCGVRTRQACTWGDPHYTTYDGLQFDYQGTCPYIVSQPCQFDSIEPYFTITAKNTQTGFVTGYGGVSGITSVELSILGVRFAVDENLKLTVDGVSQSVPYFYPSEANWRVKASVAGGFMYITTREQMEIKFARYSLCVTVPEALVGGTGRLCGLFGDVDNKCQNDLRGRQNNLFAVPSANCIWPPTGAEGLLAERFGDDWVTAKDEKCLPGVLMKNLSMSCTPSDYANARLACQPIEQAKTSSGIFAKCSSLGAKQLDDLLNGCAYDVCIDRNLRCNALVNFVRTCQQMVPGTTFSGWRNNVNCTLSCSASQTYSDCMSSCPATCANTNVSAVCDKPCVEGCTCLPGTVFDGSGTSCIPQQDCGCKDDIDGNYHESGSVWMSADCKKVSKCLEFGKKITKDVECGAGATCGSDRQCTCQPGTVGTCKNAIQTIADGKEYQLCSCTVQNPTSGSYTGSPQLTNTPGYYTGSPQLTNTPGYYTGSPQLTNTPGYYTGSPQLTNTPGYYTGSPQLTNTPGYYTGSPQLTNTPGYYTSPPYVGPNGNSGTGQNMTNGYYSGPNGNSGTGQNMTNGYYSGPNGNSGTGQNMTNGYYSGPNGNSGTVQNMTNGYYSGPNGNSGTVQNMTNGYYSGPNGNSGTGQNMTNGYYSGPNGNSGTVQNMTNGYYNRPNGNSGTGQNMTNGYYSGPNGNSGTIQNMTNGYYSGPNGNSGTVQNMTNGYYSGPNGNSGTGQNMTNGYYSGPNGNGGTVQNMPNEYYTGTSGNRGTVQDMTNGYYSGPNGNGGTVQNMPNGNGGTVQNMPNEYYTGTSGNRGTVQDMTNGYYSGTNENSGTVQASGYYSGTVSITMEQCCN